MWRQVYRRPIGSKKSARPTGLASANAARLSHEIVVLNSHVLGKTIKELDLVAAYGCFATGLNRSGVNLPVTDEVSAVESLGIATRLVENSAPNIKITVPSDLVLAEAILGAPSAPPDGRNETIPPKPSIWRRATA